MVHSPLPPAGVSGNTPEDNLLIRPPPFHRSSGNTPWQDQLPSLHQPFPHSDSHRICTLRRCHPQISPQLWITCEEAERAKFAPFRRQERAPGPEKTPLRQYTFSTSVNGFHLSPDCRGKLISARLWVGNSRRGIKSRTLCGRPDVHPGRHSEACRGTPDG